ncbi:gliding motility-associated C-terminal domain-containing protein [Ferruginibacter albus]|uniref:gliding motility-associated C-terminal domain-containing protein n=1 Tax=Ferruginibacter albus TaxID=2875540 RepID=UPI001CC82546|nr:gliding motility-associated C-terminal domain-containing protein [Ferruginibacter albus]UAY52603.1 gliding motility-associated C-terminal domain-containing protein [Ferruginibacter albus]
MKGFLFSILGIVLWQGVYSQNELKNWYFGTGTDGITFVNNVPQKLTNKVSGVGYEGMVVVNDPLTGEMLFYSDGIRVVNKQQQVMTNGSGLTGHVSGAQCVQSCPVPGTCAKQFYLFTNSAFDLTQGKVSYSIVDFTNDSLGVVINKNTLFWNGPSDQGMCLVNKPNTNDYWLIANDFATAKFNVWPLTATGIGTPIAYTFTITGSTAALQYSKTAKKICATGYAARLVTTLDFDPATGVLSNEVQLAPSGFSGSAYSRFSPDGTKLYVGLGKNGGPGSLYQYDYTTSVWTDMKTCCYAHDLKVGPDGKMYFINTYNSPQPISVIDFPNLTAVGNACNYHNLTFTPAFNGEVRRFPETVILPTPVIAVTDTATVVGNTATIQPLTNDIKYGNDVILLDTILVQPKYGTATINGNSINYTSHQCGVIDTLVYRIKNNDCASDTSQVVIKTQSCITTITVDTSICRGQSYRGYNTTGSYTDVLKNIAGSDSLNMIIHLTVNDKPSIQKTADTTICAGTSAKIFASGGSSYQWSSTQSIVNAKAAAPTVTPLSSPAVYYVTVTGANTCVNNDSVKVFIRPKPSFYVSPDKLVCTTAPVQLQAGGGDNYLWSPKALVSDANIPEPFTNSADPATTYRVTISESVCHYDTTLTTTVTLLPPLTLHITKSNDLDCNNGSAQLQASGAELYSWSPTNGLNNAAVGNPVASPSSTQKYILTGSTRNGCIGYDSVIVYADFTNSKSGYYMPNAFSPNNDGINDCYGIKYWGTVQKVDFSIYDRWGNLVFFTNDPADCWDGTYKGQPLNSGSYSYYIKAITTCGVVDRKGNIILIR